MKFLGVLFIGLCLVALGIVSVKLGWFDALINLIEGLCV